MTMTSRLYTSAVEQINARRPAAQAKPRRRPACHPDHAATYIHAMIEQEAAAGAQLHTAGPDRSYAAGLAVAYDLARAAIRRGGDIQAAVRRSLARYAHEEAQRLDLGLTVDHAYGAGFRAALADILARLAPVAAWIEQGYNARLMDLDRPTQATPEADAWRVGWDLADSLIQANADEADAKPGLDPLPLPAWAELLEAAR